MVVLRWYQMASGAGRRRTAGVLAGLLTGVGLLGFTVKLAAQPEMTDSHSGEVRERISIDRGWRFMRYNDGQQPDTLFYAAWPVVANHNDDIVADTRASITGTSGSASGLKPWVLPTANPFIEDPAGRHKRPPGDPGSNFAFVQPDFNDGKWQLVDLPHDWAITGDFYKGDDVPVGGGMGRLPVQGVAWYRRKIDIPLSDQGRRIFLDIDGAMSYAIVWLNGHLVGGWPYGYNSFRLDLTPYIRPGGINQLAIRLDNPANSSRWYPGAGIYRDVWLVKTAPVHVDQYGSNVTTRDVSENAAGICLKINVRNQSARRATVKLRSALYLLDSGGHFSGPAVAQFPQQQLTVDKDATGLSQAELQLSHPRLWQPLPFKNHFRYGVVTSLYISGQLVDQYYTRFGIRKLVYDADKGLIVNDRPVRIQGGQPAS